MIRSATSMARGTWLLLSMLALPALAACTLAQSSLFDPADPGACKTSLGSYYLSKAKIEVQVSSVVDPLAEAATPKRRVYQLEVLGIHREADPERLYCLDYLQSGTSDDLVRVWRNSQGMLIKVSSDAQDQTASILKTVIQTIFTALSGGPFNEYSTGTRAGVAGPDIAVDDTAKITLFNAKYDPTDPDRAAFVNEHLREFGFCLIALEEGGSGPRAHPDAYCENPQAHKHLVGGTSFPNLQKKLAFAPPQEGGLVYRPRLPYQLALLEKQYLKGKSRSDDGRLWRPTRRKIIWIENRSPAIAVKLDRNFFTQRTATLNFQNGTLYEVKLLKGSEFANAIEIPLQILSSVAALPANIIQVRIDQTVGQSALLEEERKLLKANEDLLNRRLVTDKPLAKGDIDKYTAFAKGGTTLPFPDN